MAGSDRKTAHINRKLLWFGTALGLAIIVLVKVISREPAHPAVATRSITVADVLRIEDGGFARALTPRPFEFPADHGPHPEFRTEWWYYSGNLMSDDGRHFGFQLTFFRLALLPYEPAGDSPWRTAQIYMADFSISDIAADRFHSFERLERGAVGLAGSQARPFRVWLDGWSARGTDTDTFPIHLSATENGLALDLSLSAGKGPIPQGDDGLSRKSGDPGNASYYYSYTRLPAAGEIQIGRERLEVSGTAWMDREWSTSALGADQVGWDWFSIQLTDSREIMFYRLRRRDGSVDPMSAGSLVSPSGEVVRLSKEDVELEPQEYWEGPHQTRYPVRWRMRLPQERLELEVAAYMLDQEHRHSFHYWEGAVSARGIEGDKPISGDGYLEMTGYEREVEGTIGR